MKTILLIETSLILGEVAIYHNGELKRAAFTENADHTRMLIPNLDRLLTELKLDFDDIDVIFVNRGPGSHTGVRVGLTTARTLAYKTDKIVLGVSALEILALKAVKTLNLTEKYKVLIPTVYCRQGELYCQKFNTSAEQLGPPCIVNSETLLKELEQNPEVYAFGQAAIKELNVENAPFETDTEFLHQRGLQIIAQQPDTLDFEDTLAPLYLRPPLATPPKKKSV